MRLIDARITWMKKKMPSEKDGEENDAAMGRHADWLEWWRECLGFETTIVIACVAVQVVGPRRLTGDGGLRNDTVIGGVHDNNDADK